LTWTGAPVRIQADEKSRRAGARPCEGPKSARHKGTPIDDYTKWRSIAGQAISGDGKWVATTLQLTNTIPAEAKPVLHLLNLETNAEVTVADAAEGTFSADSKWIAYQVDPGAAQRARASRGGSGTTPATSPATPTPSQPGATPPAPAQIAAPGAQQSQAGRGGAAPAIPPRRVELRNLATGAVRSWQDIGTIIFAPTSTHVVLRRRGAETPAATGGRGGGAPTAPGGGAPAAGDSATGAPAGSRGLDVILLDLRTGRHQLLGSVGDIAFNRTGELLATTVDAAIKDSNGVFVFDTRNGRITALDNDAKSYNRLAWSEDGNAIAVLKGSEVEKMRERDNVLVAFPDVAAAIKDGASSPGPVILEAGKAEGFPKGWLISDRAALAWSEDNKRVFFGAKEQVATPDTTRRTTDEAADVDVWNTGDERIQSAQMVRFLFTRQTFVDFPDLRISGPGFKDSKKITDANPQQAESMWGHRILFDYKNRDGVRLQGILALPDDYKPGEKRPMIVTFYEKNSQSLHRYNAPSYLTGMGGSPMQAVSAGTLTMLPDVHFRTGSSHTDMLECVEAATRKVIEMGYADPKRIAVTGHSYGGEGAAFIGTMSKMFAAVGMGAGVIDLYYDFTQNWGWAYAVTGGTGDNAFDYYFYSQGRWGFSPWDQPERYRYESAITHVPNVTAPFLIMHGGADPTVDFHNGLGFYNALRYNGKKAVFLSYPGEGHGLRGLANRKDLTIRFFEFFDHYLKGAPAPKWLTEGVPFLKKEASRTAGK
jgi:dipeptidyl aminopeptidase/acylaminoacyl peptidase